MRFEKYKIKDLISEISMGPFGSNIKVECFVDDGIPVLNGSNLEGIVLKENSFRYVTEEKANSLGKANAHRGDVVITHRGTLGQIVFIPQNSKYDRYIISQSQFRVKCNERILPEYLVYYFHTRIGRSKLLSNASQVGVPALARASTSFQKIEIEVPSIDCQLRIVDYLEIIRGKIEINNRINENLYQMVATLYASIFRERVQQTTTVGQYSKQIYSGGTPSTTKPEFWNGPLHWFSSGETRNRFAITTEKTITQVGVDNSSTKLAHKYDIVMASAGQGFTRGQTTMLLLDTYVNQSVIVIHSDHLHLPYLFWNLSSRYEELRAISDSSSIRGSLTTKMIAGFDVPEVDQQSLVRFSEFAWPIIAEIEKNLHENEHLSAIRDMLLPKLMSGEIDVSDYNL